MEKPTIHTVGHSTRPVEVLIEMIKAQRITHLVDVRTIPRSRHNPQYSRENLKERLRDAGIGYEHVKTLGGLRHPRRDSQNSGWRNESFRGYADYMQTPDFASALDGLIATAITVPTVIMCAEAVPWRCHRSLISDALTVRGCRVEHIMSASKSNPPTMTSFASVRRTSITYPSEAPDDSREDSSPR